MDELRVRDYALVASARFASDEGEAVVLGDDHDQFFVAVRAHDADDTATQVSVHHGEVVGAYRQALKRMVETAVTR